MDAAKLVKKKLDQDENCEFCVNADKIIESLGKCSRYICLIERQGDHAVFVYNSKSFPCRTEKDLSLETAIPVDDDLRIVSEPPKQGSPADQAAFLVALKYRNQSINFEFTQTSDFKKFTEELKRARDLYSQTVGFGLPSSFSWLEKYKNPGVTNHTTIVQPPPHVPDSDPFQMPTFDPLQYMNIEKDSANNKASMGFDDDFNAMSIQTAKELHFSASKDSLDNLENYSGNFQNDLSESLDKVAERELGLKPGTNLASGLKPLTARETLAEHFIKERQSEFVNIETLRVFVGTWNVNGQASGDLSEWLSCDKEPPDIYAVGFQELDLSNQAYIFSGSTKETEWQEAVRKHLHPKAKYRKVKSIRLVGVLLIVYVKDAYVDFVSLIDSDQVPTGIMGMLGNKGGVSVRLCLHSTTLCFINSHLAAHQEECDRRNQDSWDIETKLRFKQFLPPLTVNDHDIVFWLGDLNYRIDREINDVKEQVLHGRLHNLLPADQLYRQMRTNAVFKKYKEGEINFPPTYRYDPGTDNFDSSEKKRIPAWCDRVLWKGEGVRQIIYRSHPSLKISDHKPVSALFEVGVKVIERERYKKVYEDIMKKLDRLENDYLPQVSLDHKEFVFKDVRFNESKGRMLAIANIGQVPVTYEFINKLDENSYCKPWLKVLPYTGVISPGYSCEISLEVVVDKSCAYLFNRGEYLLEDILVLHLHGGKDFFVPITGNYIPSSFGSSIEALIQIHGPVSKVPLSQLVELEKPGSLKKVDILAQGTRLYVIPKEIFRLVDHIWQYGRHQSDLFQQPGLNTEMHAIRDFLDNNTSLETTVPGSIHSVAEALLLFLGALSEPVIPYSQYNMCLDCCNNFLLCKQVLSKVYDHHRNVFKYICAFLRQLLQEAEHNNLTIKYLACQFGEVMLRAPTGKESPIRTGRVVRSEEMKKAAFLYHFLANEYDD